MNNFLKIMKGCKSLENAIIFQQKNEEVNNKTVKLFWLSIHKKVHFVSLNYMYFLQGALSWHAATS